MDKPVKGQFEDFLAHAIDEPSVREQALALHKQALDGQRLEHEDFVEEIYQGYEEELEVLRATDDEEKLNACAELVREAQSLARQAISERDQALEDLTEARGEVQVTVAQSIASLESQTQERIEHAVLHERAQNAQELKDLNTQVGLLQRALADLKNKHAQALREARVTSQELVHLVEDLELKLTEAKNSVKTEALTLDEAAVDLQSALAAKEERIEELEKELQESYRFVGGLEPQFEKYQNAISQAEREAEIWHLKHDTVLETLNELRANKNK